MICVLLAGLCGPAKATDDLSFQERYDIAVEARRDGRFEAAIENFERALAKQPHNTDVMVLLAGTYGFVERYDDAVAMYRAVLELVPDSADAQIGIARVLSWQGRFAEALDLASAAAQAHPDNVEAAVLVARIHYYIGDTTGANQAIETSLEVFPGHAELWSLKGDVALAQEDFAAARNAFARALEIEPGLDAAIRGMERTDAAEADAERIAEASRRMEEPVGQFERNQEPTVFATQLDFAVSHSGFSRSTLEPWYEVHWQLTQTIDERVKAYIRQETSDRSVNRDTYVEAGTYIRVRDGTHAYGFAGVTPDASFRPDVQFGTGGTQRLADEGNWIGTLVGTFDGKWSQYAAGDVWNLSPGVEQYLFSGAVWINARWINIIDENNDWQMGWLAALYWQLDDVVRFHGGMSVAPETENNRTLSTTSYFGGVTLDISPRFAVRFDVLHEYRQGSYMRRSITTNTTLRF